ncbi:hypothetical protein ACG02S_25445 [Roseateles sp. DC23W]|uniref:Uncharacterized protein n=1 Tax=Pelomonas dachongensis TaxID=3299029 RepID=A0ABW7EX98_9BURK
MPDRLWRHSGGHDRAGGRFEALVGTSVVIARADGPTLPAAMGTASQLRNIVYGVAEDATLI